MIRRHFTSRRQFVLLIFALCFVGHVACTGGLVIPSQMKYEHVILPKWFHCVIGTSSAPDKNKIAILLRPSGLMLAAVYNGNCETDITRNQVREVFYAGLHT